MRLSQRPFHGIINICLSLMLFESLCFSLISSNYPSQLPSFVVLELLFHFPVWYLEVFCQLSSYVRSEFLLMLFTLEYLVLHYESDQAMWFFCVWFWCSKAHFCFHYIVLYLILCLVSMCWFLLWAVFCWIYQSVVLGC